ncbi:hypothetical protein lerEdw1_019381 [Lerista edwardsae]|nr:hypothetical protein lerEdw1_019381 [Lerista edwardsae]
MPKLPLSPVPEQESEGGGLVPSGSTPDDCQGSPPQPRGEEKTQEREAAAGQSAGGGAEDTEDASSGKGSEDESEADDGREDEWDTDLELEDSKTLYDPAGKAKYLHTCHVYGVVPISYFVRHMKDPELALMHRGLCPKGLKALALSLTSNTSVLKLNLSDNGIDEEGAVAVAEMLKDNCYISDVDLSENRIGVGGVKALAAALQENSTLAALKLSGNELNDAAAKYLADAFATNTKANIFLRVLDLSYNGFGNSGAATLGEALKANNVLEDLRVGNNHISLEGALRLALGLKENKTLRSLSLPRNPIQSEGCSGILRALQANPDSALEVLDFSEIVVQPDFARHCDAVQEALPGLQIKHDGTSRGFGADRAKVRIRPHRQRLPSAPAGDLAQDPAWTCPGPQPTAAPSRQRTGPVARSTPEATPAEEHRPREESSLSLRIRGLSAGLAGLHRSEAACEDRQGSPGAPRERKASLGTVCVFVPVTLLGVRRQLVAQWTLRPVLDPPWLGRRCPP